MGGSSKKGLPSQMGPASAGGPTPTLVQAQPYYPSYPSYTPQSLPSNSAIGLSIPSDINSLRQAAANQPSPMLVNRVPFGQSGYAPRYSINQNLPSFINTPQNFAPKLSFIPVNPEPPKPAQPVNGDGGYQEWNNGSNGGGN